MNESCRGMPFYPLYLLLSAKSALEIQRLVRSPPLESLPRLPKACWPRLSQIPLATIEFQSLLLAVDCDFLKDKAYFSLAFHLWRLGKGHRPSGVWALERTVSIGFCQREQKLQIKHWERESGMFGEEQIWIVEYTGWAEGTARKAGKIRWAFRDFENQARWVWGWASWQRAANMCPKWSRCGR